MVLSRRAQGAPDGECRYERFRKRDEVGLVSSGLFDQADCFVRCFLSGEEDGGDVGGGKSNLSGHGHRSNQGGKKRLMRRQPALTYIYQGPLCFSKPTPSQVNLNRAVREDFFSTIAGSEQRCTYLTRHHMRLCRQREGQATVMSLTNHRPSNSQGLWRSVTNIQHVPGSDYLVLRGSNRVWRSVPLPFRFLSASNQACSHPRLKLKRLSL